MKQVFCVATAAALAALAVANPAPAPVAAPTPPDNPDNLMIFLCDQLPEICTNMCYGAYCKKIGESLTYDKPDSKEKRKRRKAAGCIASGGNRCSTKKNHPKGYQCDEYPFASTVARDVTTRINRCVPAEQNRKQGGIINAFYRGNYCKGGPCDFTAKFANPGGASNADICKYPSDVAEAACKKEEDKEESGPGGEPNDDDKAEDGTDDDGGNPEPEKKRSTPIYPRYRTSSGLEFELPGGAKIGQRAVTVLPKNATLWDEQARSHEYDPDDEDGEYDYMLDNLDVRDDTIVMELTS